MSFRKLFLLGFIIILLVTIPVTVYFIQQQQEIRIQAERTTVVSFMPSSTQNSPIQKLVGDVFELDIHVDPGTNIVNSIVLDISYDSTKLATEVAGLTFEGNTLPSIVSEPQYRTGNIYVVLASGTDLTRQIEIPTTIGKVKFRALASTGTTTTQVSFGQRTNAYIGSATTPGTNEEPYNILAEGTGEILKNTTPAFIKIAEAAVGSPTPTPPTSISPTPSIQTTPGPSPTRTPTPSRTPTPGGPTSTPRPTTVGGINQPPICSSLNIDRTASGTAPFSITFTANGSDSDGTINKAAFNFGDGTVQDVTQAGGIGTSSVSVQLSHTYNNSGSFNASVILTDDKGAVSSIGTCTQRITVTQGGIEPTDTIISDFTPTPTPFGIQPTTPPIVITTSPGPDGAIVGIGAAGLILTILGAFLFFAL